MGPSPARLLRLPVPAPLTAGVVLVLLVLAAAGAPRRPDAGDAPAPNPHWSPTGCLQCHPTDTPSPAALAPRQVEELCRGCHDGRRAAKTPHPSYRPPAGPQLKPPPADWPLLDERLACLTCHDPLPGCRRQARRPALNPAFLRGYDGRDPAEFCNRCHLRAETPRFSPHAMIDPNGRIVEAACTYCHLGVPGTKPAPEAAAPTAKLHHPAPALCLGCHPRHRDYFEPGHLNARVSPQMKAWMAAVEHTPPGQRPEPNTVRQALRQELQPQRLPLADRDRVACTTCHNPHQQGVFPAGSPQASGALPTQPAPKTLALRYQPAELCRACHQK